MPQKQKLKEVIVGQEQAKGWTLRPQILHVLKTAFTLTKLPSEQMGKDSKMAKAEDGEMVQLVNACHASRRI